jgi:hypothetical protein
MLIEAEGEGRRNGRWKVESYRVRGRHCLYCSRLHMQKAFPRLHACNVVSLVESFAAQRSAAQRSAVQCSAQANGREGVRRYEGTFLLVLVVCNCKEDLPMKAARGLELD